MSKGNVCRAGFGFRAHSGWAVLVAVTGQPGSSRPPAVLDRRRVPLADPAIRGSVQPYHAVRALPLPQARQHLDRCSAAGRRLSYARPLPELDPLLHTAEGEMFPRGGGPGARVASALAAG